MLRVGRSARVAIDPPNVDHLPLSFPGGFWLSLPSEELFVFLQLFFHQLDAEGEDGDVIQISHSEEHIGYKVQRIEHIEEGQRNGTEHPVGDLTILAADVVPDER